MPKITCFNNTSLQDKFNQLVKPNASIKEELDIALKLIQDNHKELYDKLNSLKTELKLPINSFKKINSKYSEIKIEKKEAVINKPNLFNLKNISRKSNLGAGEYSRIGQSDLSEDRITEQDLAILKEWHKENIPNLPYQVLSNLVQTYDNKRAWGVYENGVAKFYRGAIKGTEYHEIMEGIWASFLTSDERQELLDEFKSQSGTFRDRESGKNIRFDEATDQQAKERIMDDFAEFRKGKIQAKSLGEKIVQFFRNIINFVKSFVNTPSKKDELFNAINEGRFKYATPQINDYLPAYSRIGNLTEKTINEFTQDMTYRFFGEIFGGNYSLFNPTTTDSNEIFEKIRQFYIENDLIDENNENALSEEEYKGLVLNTKDYLTTFKIQFDEDNQVTINDENKTQNEYTKDPFTTNWKKSSPFAIKILLASLIETKHINQEGSLSLPEARTNSFGGVKLLNFSKGFATVMEKLSNTTDPKLFVEKLVDLARNDGDYVRLLTRLGANYSSIKNEVSPELDYGKMDADDWRTFIQFYQLFSKQKPLAYIQQINGSETYTLPADRFTATVKERNSWINNIKVKSNDKKSIIFYEPKTKSYQVKDVKGIKIKTPKDMIDFLSKIGVEFPLEAYVRLNDKQKDKFADYVSSIKEYLGKDKTILSLSGENTNVSGTLLKLADLLITVTNPNQDIVHIGIDNKMLQNHSENNVLSIFANDFNSSSTLTELLEKRPELNDVFSKNSIFLKKGGLYWDESGNRINTIKVGYIQGTDNFDSGKARTTSSLSKADRFMQEINQNLYGRYYVLVPADGSTEWLMEFENLINLNGIQTGTAWNTVYSTFRNYLKDEIKLAQENRKYLKNVKPRAQELRFFKDIIDSKSLNNTIDSLIKSKAEESEIDAFIQNNEAEINEAIKNAVIYHKDRLLKQLEESNRLQNITDDSYILLGLDTNFAKENKLSLSNMTNKQINDLLSYITINSIIANIEFHKTIFGDPYQFEIKKGNQLDETKRTKSFESPRRTTFDTPEYNTFLNQNINKAGEIELKPEDPGYRFHKSYFNSVIVNDVIINTPIYDKVNEADAATLISLPAFREFKLKNGQWDLNGKAEKWYQYQMAYERQNSPNYEYTSKALENQDIEILSENEPDYKIEVLKPIGTGSKHNKSYIDNILYKTSAMPIWYKQAEGRNLEKLYLKMIKENKDIIVMTSAAKEGIEESHSLYTEKGDFNEEQFNNNIEVPWKIFGVQVENSYDKPKSQTWGTQFPKVVTTNLYENGQIVGNDQRKEYISSLLEQDKNIRKSLFESSYNNLLDKLGIEDSGENFTLVDNISISQLLQQQLLARDASNNLKDLVRLDENGQFRMPFEASANYIQIKDILYAQINDAFISPKVSGGAHVQVPVTLWESSKEGRGLAIKTKEGYKKISKEEYENLSETDKKKVTLTSDTLKFYTKEDPYMEVLLPAWFLEQFPKNRFKTEADILKVVNSSPDFKEILKGIGFRIPTQATSSIENFRIKGFLPASMGATVVVPSEITTKAGSDFDIDKLNLYLKSIYVDEQGKIKLVKYLGSEKATKDHFAKLFDKKWEKEKFRKQEIVEAIQLVQLGKDTAKALDSKNLVAKYSDYLNQLVVNDEDFDTKAQQLLDDLETLSDDEVKSIERDRYIRDMFKRSLENEWFSVMEKILALPEKFQELISPIDDAGLEDLAKSLDDARKDTESSIKNRLLDKTYMTNLRHAFLTGKKWVGIAAVNITAHSLFQKSQMFVDTDRFHLVPALDKKFLGDGSIILPHSILDGKPSLSGIKTADGKELISNRLSGYGTAFVDVAKNPYILKIIKNELVVGTFMFLERLGVGENTAWFLNQPIISEYLEYLENSGERNLFKKTNLETIRAKFPTSKSALDKAEINVNELKDNIKTYYEKGRFGSDLDNAVQQLILAEFLKYSKMAEHSFKMTQATNFDTTRFRGQEDIFKKNRRVETARRTNIINSVDKLLDNTFIGDMRYWLIQSSEALGAVVKTDQYNIRDSAINPVLAQFADNEYLAADKYTNIANKIITSFVDYLVQTRTELNSNIKELLVDSSTFVANELVKAKEYYPNIRILNQLESISSSRVDGATSLKLKVKPTETFDQNLYIEMMRELREFEPTNKLYENIVRLSLLQGTYSSPISIGSIIPIEDRQKYITPIINTLSQDADFEGFTNGAFQRNNWKNDDIFYNLDLRATQSKSEYNEQQEMLEDIYNIPGKYEYSFPAFGEYFNNNERNVFKQLNLKTRDRQLLFLSEDFDYIATTKDFISVNRLQKSKDGNFVSVTTGKSFSGKDYKKAKEEGNLSIYDIYGYQKVKYSDGTPVTFNAKTKDDSTKMHVYKLINLWGDGIFASEYYNDNRKSVFNNGTMKTTELQDSDIIKYYTPLPKKKTYEDEVNDAIADTKFNKPMSSNNKTDSSNTSAPDCA